MPRARLLSSPNAREVVQLERRVDASGDDLRARQRLGALLLRAADTKGAIEHLGRVVDAGAADASTRVDYAIALGSRGDNAAAAVQLETARQRLLDPDARFAAGVLLARAYADSEQGAKSLEVATEVCAERPEHPQAIGAWVAAMIVSGRKDEARADLERRLDTETGRTRHALRRLYEQTR